MIVALPLGLAMALVIVALPPGLALALVILGLPLMILALPLALALAQVIRALPLGLVMRSLSKQAMALGPPCAHPSPSNGTLNPLSSH